MKLITIALFFLESLVGATASAALPKFTIIDEPCPKSAYGSITRYSISSVNLQSDIIVDVWTPNGYDPSDDGRYPVVYAHDGQNLFDGSYSFAGVPWAVDNACFQLSSDSNFDMPIVVGINNRGSE
ncbi:MAG: hypothetical protein HDS72_10730, partial [Bacteroidales bacterium]|nr:hypothetical protein [Bacteroidales bacterium]